MSKIICFGSLNIDKVYQVPHIVRPGETLSGTAFEVGCGGKGGNQSVALGRAGAKAMHAGCVGSDGTVLIDNLQKSGVDTSLIRIVDQPTGHAIIQVDSDGQNSIILFPGANHAVTEDMIDQVIAAAEPGDYILLQNEINLNAKIIEKSSHAGLITCLNFAPFDTASAQKLPLEKIDILIVNEHEGAGLTGTENPDKIIYSLLQKYPNMTVVLTLGADGVICGRGGELLREPVYDTGKVIDTTAAGDTFTGYFLEALVRGIDLKHCLERASKAAGITVSRPGAADSIPFSNEIEDCN